MDFLYWQKQLNEQYGMSEEDWNVLTKAGVVRFDYDEKGYVSGMYKGKTVYRDGNHELDINPGDIWVVSLSLNPKTNSNYFAKPLMRIDGSFLYEMKKDQIDALAKHLWETNKVILEPALEENYEGVVAEKIAKGVSEQTEAYRLSISALEERVAELERINAEDKQIIESKEAEINLLNAKMMVMEHEPPSLKAESLKGSAADPVPEGFEPVKPPKHVIVRTGPDSIRSDGFKKSRYFVHMSSDHRLLLVRDDKNGNVVCIDNTIMLAGLNSVVPFTEECELPSEYSPRYGGTLVSLK